MLRPHRLLATAALVAGLAASPVFAAESTPKATPADAGASADSAALHRLFEDYFERQMQLNPLIATFIGDHRYDDKLTNNISPEQRENAKAIMRLIVEAPAPHCSAEIAFSDGYPPLAPSDGNRKLLVLYDQASRDLGTGPVEAVDPSRAGAADVSFTAGLVPMAIDGIGMRGDGGHTVEETARLDWLPWQAKRAALLLSRLPGPAAARKR